MQKKPQINVNTRKSIYEFKTFTLSVLLFMAKCINVY